MKNYLAFYAKNPFAIMGVTQKIFDTKYVLLMQLEAENLDDAYMQMQGENWSPEGEAKDIIKKFGLSHTSMMTKDILYCVEDDIFYLVNIVGFTQIPLTR